MTVHIPEDEEDFLKKRFPDEWIDRRYPINTSKLDWEDIFEAMAQFKSQQLQSFREKLENITIDELLKNTGIILELFDEHFK